MTDIQNAKTLRLYKLYTHHILIYSIFMIRMFCNLIRTCSLSSLITKIDWINLDRRSKKEVPDKNIRFFLEFECFETIMTPLHCTIPLHRFSEEVSYGKRMRDSGNPCICMCSFGKCTYRVKTCCVSFSVKTVTGSWIIK